MARAELETDRFPNLVSRGVICGAMPALGPRGGPRVTADQAPRQGGSVGTSKEPHFNGVMRKSSCHIRSCIIDKPISCELDLCLAQFMRT